MWESTQLECRFCSAHTAMCLHSDTLSASRWRMTCVSSELYIIEQYISALPNQHVQCGRKIFSCLNPFTQNLCWGNLRSSQDSSENTLGGGLVQERRSICKMNTLRNKCSQSAGECILYTKEKQKSLTFNHLQSIVFKVVRK